MIKTVSEHLDGENFLAALCRIKIASRGPKSSSALREFNVPVTVLSPEPFTWQALVQAMEGKFGNGLTRMNIAVQEYGISNPEFLTALAERTASVARVLVYQWAMPEDLQPLRDAVIALANRQVNVVLFMNAGQVAHLFVMAERLGYTGALYEGLRSTVIGSIGPSTTEGLSMYSLNPDFEPSQSKMGFLIKEISEKAEELLIKKRAATSLH